MKNTHNIVGEECEAGPQKSPLARLFRCLIEADEEAGKGVAK